MNSIIGKIASAHRAGKNLGKAKVVVSPEMMEILLLEVLYEHGMFLDSITEIHGVPVAEDAGLRPGDIWISDTSKYTGKFSDYLPKTVRRKIRPQR